MHCYTGLIDKYREFLPINNDVAAVSLHEGNTPLIKLSNLSRSVGNKHTIYGKFEGLNPTGSFKDRGMTLAVSMAKNQGKKAVICASTGNTSASAAAYAARAGMACFVIIPEGKIAFGKLSQALIHGAQVLQIRGNFDEGMQLVKDLSKELGIGLVNSVNPYRLQGQKTIAFEIFEQLGRVPDYHAVPVGNAANISAHWMGYNELCGKNCYFPEAIKAIYETQPIAQQKVSDDLPVMLGYQAQGAASMVHGKNIENPETLATAIRIGNPQSRQYASQSVVDSGGWFAAYSDEQMLKTQHLLAKTDGIFCELASVVSLVGVLDDIENNRIPEGATIVCTLTGNGIKDPDVVVNRFSNGDSILTIDSDYQKIQQFLKQAL